MRSGWRLGGFQPGPGMRAYLYVEVFDGFNNNTFLRPKLKLVYGR